MPPSTSPTSPSPTQPRNALVNSQPRMCRELASSQIFEDSNLSFPLQGVLSPVWGGGEGRLCPEMGSVPLRWGAANSNLQRVFLGGYALESVSHFIFSAHLPNDLQWDSGNADSHQGSDTSWGHGAPPPVSREMRIAALIAWDLSPPMKANFGSLEASLLLVTRPEAWVKSQHKGRSTSLRSSKNVWGHSQLLGACSTGRGRGKHTSWWALKWVSVRKFKHLGGSILARASWPLYPSLLLVLPRKAALRSSSPHHPWCPVR